MIPGILRWWTNRRVDRVTMCPPGMLWPRIKAVWKRARYVDRGFRLSGTESVEYLLLRKLVRRYPEKAEQFFLEGILDTNVMVCAYSIVGLYEIGKRIDPSVLPFPHKVVEWRTGRMRGWSSLHEFAEISCVVMPYDEAE